MSTPWFGDSQLRQTRQAVVLLPPLQPLHALRTLQLPIRPAPFQQLADGVGKFGLTEAREIGNNLANQTQFAGGEHAPAERNGFLQRPCSLVTAICIRSRREWGRSSGRKSPAKSVAPDSWRKWPISSRRLSAGAGSRTTRKGRLKGGRRQDCPPHNQCRMIGIGKNEWHWVTNPPDPEGTPANLPHNSRQIPGFGKSRWHWALSPVNPG